MFLDGLLSILQICFLPGLVILAFFNLNAIDRAVLSVPMSLLANYFVFYLLVLLGWYTRDVVLVIIAMEVVALLILYPKYAKTRVLLTSPQPIEQPDWSLSPHIKTLFFLLALFASGWLIFKILALTPSQFTFYDDVPSWTHWAADWSKGALPFRAWEYPQLLPINWSITYNVMGTHEFAYFATFVNGIIALYVLGVFWGMYFDSRWDIFLVAVSIAGMWMCFMLEPFIGKGMADVPSAFFGVMMLYVAYLGLSSRINITQFIILGALVVAGAVSTKQTGNYLVIYYLCVSIFLAKKASLSLTNSVRLIMTGLGLIFLLAWSWYFYHKFQLAQGTERLNVYYASELIYEGKSYWERFIMANTDIRTGIQTLDFLWPRNIVFGVGILMVCGLIYLSLQSAFGALASIAVTIPFYFIWAALFSYGAQNQRNFALALGFLTVSMACGLVYVCAKIIPAAYKKNPRLIKTSLISLLTLLILSGLYRLNNEVPANRILQSKLYYLKVQHPHSVLYQAMYSLYEKKYFAGKVLTNYGCDRSNAFPGMQELFVTLEPDNFMELEKLLFGGKYRYFLFFHGQYTPKIYDEGVENLIKEGRLVKAPVREAAGKDRNETFILYEIKS